MATQADVRRIALTLPGTREEKGRFAFTVDHKGKAKGFVWSWMERVHPKKARVESHEVIAVRVRNEAEKATLLAGDPESFFTEPHYNGYPAVLVRLRAVTAAQLRPLLLEAWRCLAPRELQEPLAARRPGRRKEPSRSGRGRSA